MEAFNRNEYLVSIFFDLEKAYDTTWRYNILQELLNHGLKGNLVHFISNFLMKRKFTVSLGGITSKSRIMENGIPQGSVLSVTLFILAINSIFRSLSVTPVKSIMYADDLCIFVSSKEIDYIKEQLQTSLEVLEVWSRGTGFKFSEVKTTATIFTRKKRRITIGLYLHGKK